MELHPDNRNWSLWLTTKHVKPLLWANYCHYGREEQAQQFGEKSQSEFNVYQSKILTVLSVRFIFGINFRKIREFTLKFKMSATILFCENRRRFRMGCCIF